MNYLWILLFMLLHYGLAKLHYGLTKHVSPHVRYKVTREQLARARRCKILTEHAHTRKVLRGSKVCGGGLDQIGIKRDLLPSRFDESKEFGGQMQVDGNAARRSGLYRNNGESMKTRRSGLYRNTGESMLPYPPLLNGAPTMANFFRNRQEEEGDSPEDLEERQQELDNQQQASMHPPNNLAQFPFMSPPRDALPVPGQLPGQLPGQFERSPPTNFEENPLYPTPMNQVNMAGDSRHLMPNGMPAGGEQLENALERYMYGLSVARAPQRSSLNLPGDFSQAQPDMSSLVSSGLQFPPYNGPLPLRDNTVVPNMGGNIAPMDMPPQGEMQVAPRPLGAPFFMAQRTNGGLFRRGDMMGPSNVRSNYLKPEVPFRNPMMRERRKPAPDVTAMNNIFNDIEDDEKEYKEVVGNNLAAQRKDVVERGNYYQQRGYAQPTYRNAVPNYRSARPNYRSAPPNYRSVRPNYRSVRPNYRSARPNYRSARPNYRDMTYDNNIDTGNPMQNSLEQKYEMVLNSIANTDNYIRTNKANIDNFDRNYLDRNVQSPSGLTTMGSFGNEESMFNERVPFNRYGRYQSNDQVMNNMEGYEMMPDKRSDVRYRTKVADARSRFRHHAKLPDRRSNVWHHTKVADKRSNAWQRTKVADKRSHIRQRTKVADK